MRSTGASRSGRSSATTRVGSARPAELLFAEVVEPSKDRLFGQLLFSYKLDARTALWFGYTSNYLDEAHSGLTETGNSVFFKLSYAWQP